MWAHLGCSNVLSRMLPSLHGKQAARGRVQPSEHSAINSGMNGLLMGCSASYDQFLYQEPGRLRHHSEGNGWNRDVLR